MGAKSLEKIGEEKKKKEILWDFWREKGYIKTKVKENENFEAKKLHRENVEKIQVKIKEITEKRKKSKSIKSKWEILKSCTEIIEKTCENWGNPEECLEIEKFMIELGEKREKRLKQAQEQKRNFNENFKKPDCDNTKTDQENPGKSAKNN